MNSREFVLGSIVGIGTAKPLAPALDKATDQRAGAEVTQSPARTFAPSDIRRLTQHFNDLKGNYAPRMFIPQNNIKIKEISTAESLGLAAFWPAAKEKDLKGIMKKPIRIDEYPLPWESQLGMVQNFGAMADIKPQSNYAIGLNVVVTFSDPSTWPEDRTKMPSDTHTVQLLVACLSDLRKYTELLQADNFFVWCRGDLDYNLIGDWRVLFIRIEDGACYAGPVSNGVYFRSMVRGPGKDRVHAGQGPAATSSNLVIGIKFDAGHGLNMRDFDTSHLDKITGIWEIGPITSRDRWIPDVFWASLPLLRESIKNPVPLPPDPSFEQYVNYCALMRSRLIPFEEMSDDFDIPRYLGQWVSQDQSTIAETYANQGHLRSTFESNCEVGNTAIVGTGLTEGRQSGPYLKYVQ